MQAIVTFSVTLSSFAQGLSVVDVTGINFVLTPSTCLVTDNTASIAALVEGLSLINPANAFTIPSATSFQRLFSVSSARRLKFDTAIAFDEGSAPSTIDFERPKRSDSIEIPG